MSHPSTLHKIVPAPFLHFSISQFTPTRFLRSVQLSCAFPCLFGLALRTSKVSQRRTADARSDAGIDACMMSHPGHGQAGIGSVTPSLAIQTIHVEYFGKTSHAAGAPWAGINALDAAVVAYSSVSAMRQQLKPTDR